LGNNKNQFKIRDSVYGEISARYVERYGAVLRRELAVSKKPEGAADDDGEELKKPAAADEQGTDAPEAETSERGGAKEDGGTAGGGGGWAEIGTDSTESAEKDQKLNEGPSLDAEQNRGSGGAAKKRRSAIRQPDDVSGQRAGITQPERKLMTPGAEIDDRIVRGLTSERRKSGFYRFFIISAIVLALVVTVTATGLPSLLASWWGSLYDRITVDSGNDGTTGAARTEAAVTNPQPTGGAPSITDTDDTRDDYAPEESVVPLTIDIKPAYSVVSTVYDSGRTIYFITNTRQDNIVLSLRRGGVSDAETADLTPVSVGGTTVYLAYDADYSAMVYEKDGIVHELTCRFDVNTLIDFCGFDRQDFARGVLNPQHTVGGAWLVSERSLSNIPLRSETASYADIRRHISSGGIPPAGAVATEEVINFFPAEIEMPGLSTFSAMFEIGPSPFNEERAIAYVRIKAPEIDFGMYPPSSLTFLINTSSSMFSFDKLPLIKDAVLNMADISGGRDRLSIVTYDEGSAVLLDNARSDDASAIRGVLDGLTVGGNSGAESGIETAYSIALKNFLNGGNNIVVAITDENDNFGLAGRDELDELVARNRSGGVDLRVLGVGALNGWGGVYPQDGDTPEPWRFTRANTLSKTEAALLNELSLQAYAAAGNVVAQIEFNPHNVVDYNLVGYENRLSRNRDKLFSLGETTHVYAGDEIILLYEITFTQPIVPGEDRRTAPSPSPATRANETQPAQTGGTNAASSPEPDEIETDAFADELFELRIKYTVAGESQEKIYAKAATFDDYTDENSSDYRLACSVAAFCGILGDTNRLEATIELAEELAEAAVGENADGLRSAYLNLIKQYRGIIEE